MRRGLVAVAIATLLEASCTIVIDTSNLYGGGSASTPVGTSGADPAETTDADGGTRDGSRRHPGADGSIVDTPASSLCADGTHFLCADFDEGDLQAGWTSQNVGQGASLALDEDHVSSPRSLRVTIPASGQRVARLDRELPSQPKHAHVSMQLFMCAHAQGDNFELLKFEDSGGAGGVKLNDDANGGFMNVDIPNTSGQVFALTRPLPRNRWVKLDIDVTFDSAAGALSVIYDGNVTALSRTNIRTVGSSAIRLLRMGLWTPGAAATCTARFDDVVVDLDL
jgi:hypothetical protein